MVSKRQKLARQKFKQEHPELFPKPEPTPPKDPTKAKKKKKKNTKFKPQKGDKPKTPKSGFKKHPLRVPGMKPGESCFICKAKDHIAKLCPQKAEWERNKICLLCRRRGHSLKNCPNKTDETTEKKFCYNCGETGHSLSHCSQPLRDGGTKFANCFICNEQGHLSKNCPKNTHGIYPKGGSCKLCGEVTHLARDCPNKVSRSSAYGIRNTQIGGEPAKRSTKIRFTSGDDLDDDFMPEVAATDTDMEDPKSDSIPLVDTTVNNSEAKLKKKKGPKVVNFVG